MYNAYSLKNDPKISETIADNLIKILSDGPDVSFNGSPTVSPTTAALWGSLDFLKYSVGCSGLANFPAKI